MIRFDPDDTALVEPYGWYIVRDNGNKYAYANVPGGTIKMHRLIMGVTDPKVRIDHINGDGLDNRRANLRLATGRQNSQNMKKQIGRSSIYKGVYRHQSPGKRVSRWRAMIRVNGKRISLGYFDDETDAARAYDATASLHFGEYARLNFPEATKPGSSEEEPGFQSSG